jgi:tRNA(adenine34) deaminase
MTAAPPSRDADEQLMLEAIAEAEAAGQAGDVPVGAVVVLDGRIIGRGGNRRERDGDPTAHAEMIALRQAAQAIAGWRLVGATLYVTQEPCPMCAGAIVHARVARVVFGCSNPKAGAVRTLYQLLEDPRLNHRAEVVGGVLEEATSELLRRFFAELRKQ